MSWVFVLNAFNASKISGRRFSRAQFVKHHNRMLIKRKQPIEIIHARIERARDFLNHGDSVLFDVRCADNLYRDFVIRKNGKVHEMDLKMRN